MTSTWRRLWLVAGLASLLDSAAIVSVGSALPVWRTAFDLDDWTVGAISSAMTVSIAVGALVGGRLADTHGRGRVFSATVGLYAVGATVVAGASSTPVLVAGVVLLGLGSGADLPASLALVAERAPADMRGRLVARTQVLWTVGIVVATALALGASPFALPGTRVAFGVLAAGAVLTVVARARALPPPGPTVATAPRPDDPVPPSTHGPAPTRVLVLVALFYVLYTLVANTFGGFRTYFLVVVGGADQTAATAVSFGLTLVGLVGTVVFSTLVHTSWRRRIFPVGAVVLVASQVVIAVTVAESFRWVLLALLAYTLVYPYVGEGLYKVWAQESVDPALRGTFQGATIAAARAVAAGFAVVTPTLMSRDPALLFWLLAGCAAGSGVLGSLILRSSARPLR